MPEVELKGLDAIEVEKPVVEVTDADVDTMLETLRKQQATRKKLTVLRQRKIVSLSISLALSTVKSLKAAKLLTSFWQWARIA